MKKLCKPKGKFLFRFRKNLKVKLTFALLSAFLGQINAYPSYGQNARVTLHVKNMTLEKTLGLIESQTPYKFVYKDRDLDYLKDVSIDAQQEDLSNVLARLFLHFQIDYQMLDNQIILKPKPAENREGSQRQAQLRGNVTDGAGKPLPGASIAEKGTGNSIITDSNGHFSIKVSDENAVLIISYVGFTTQEIQVKGKTVLNVALTEDAAGLDEVVVIGYGTASRRNITGSIATVSPAAINTQPKSNVAEMLDGRLPGVQIMSDNSPGGGVAIRVRGFSTINSNDPLVIIDGVPAQNSLNGINPADIETIQVLKDAASASIYGARAANGVVIITTKKGQKSDKGPQLSLTGYTGIQSNFNLPKMLNAQQYGDLLWQATRNDGRTPSDDIYGNDPERAIVPEWLDEQQTIPSGDVNWLDAITRKALVQSYDLSLSSANDKEQHLFSLGYFDQDGLLEYTYFKRYSGRLNNSYKITNFLTVGENLTANYKEDVSVGTNAALGSITLNALDYLPVLPVKDIHGNYVLNPSNDDHNPLEQLYRGKDNKGKSLSALGNLYANIDIDHFSFKSSIGMDYQNNNGRSYSPKDKNSTGSLSTSNNFNRQLSFTNTLNYINVFGLHAVDVLAGQEAIDYYNEGFNASRQNFLYDDEGYRYLDFGSENQLNSGNASGWALNSYFGRLNYRYDEKYLFTATVRRDGSSRFSGNNKWGTFPAFSLGWRLDRESFFKKNGFLSSLLIRGSWGQTGNQDIASYATVDSYRNNNSNSNYPLDGSQGSVYTGLTQSRIPNPDLKWETTTQKNIGFDLGLWEDRLSISADYYEKNTKDILVYSTVPLTYGGTNDGQWLNDGKMKNNGVELNINYLGKTGDLGYTIGLNLTRSKNELTSLSSSEYLGIPSSSLHSVNFDQEISRSTVGQPIGSFFGYVADGLFQSQEEIDQYGMQPNARPGDLKFRDVNGDGKVDGDDRTYIGSPHPDLMLGLNLKFDYKNFDLNMFFSGSFGNDIYNFTRYRGHFFDQNTNKSVALLEAWTPDHTDTDIPRLSLDDPNNNIRPSSYYVEDGTYVRLNNLQLGYTFPGNLLGKPKLRLFVQGSNLFTITNYSGVNPQVGLQNYNGGNRNLDIGVDRGLYPPSRTFTFGCNFNF